MRRHGANTARAMADRGNDGKANKLKNVRKPVVIYIFAKAAGASSAENRAAYMACGRVKKS